MNRRLTKKWQPLIRATTAICILVLLVTTATLFCSVDDYREGKEVHDKEPLLCLVLLETATAFGIRTLTMPVYKSMHWNWSVWMLAVQYFKVLNAGTGKEHSTWEQHQPALAAGPWMSRTHIVGQITPRSLQTSEEHGHRNVQTSAADMQNLQEFDDTARIKQILQVQPPKQHY